MSTLPINKGRAYEFVTPQEFEKLPRIRVNHDDVLGMLRDIRSMADGEGLRIKVGGTATDLKRKREAACKRAVSWGLSVQCLTRNGYLYIRKVNKK